MIDQSELANRYFWILEYITVDHLDPVSTVQKQLRKGSYRKKHGSRYDSHNEDLGLFAMLSPPTSDPEPAVFYSPSIAARGDALSPAELAIESDSWRSGAARGRFSPSKLSRRGSFRGSSFGGKHASRGLQRSQSLQMPPNGSNGSTLMSGSNLSNGSNGSNGSNLSNGVNGSIGSIGSTGSNGVMGSGSVERSCVSPRLARGRGSRRSTERSLERWESEGAGEGSLEEGIKALGSEGTAWDQFRVNRERFGVESGFNEALYTMPMSSLEVNEKEWKEVVRIAEEMGETGELDGGIEERE